MQQGVILSHFIYDAHILAYVRAFIVRGTQKHKIIYAKTERRCSLSRKTPELP